MARCARHRQTVRGRSWDSAAHQPPFRRAKHRHSLATAGRSPVSIDTVSSFALSGCTAGHTHREPRTLAWLAPHRHVAAHHARELAGDGKPKPRSTKALSGRGIGLAELLEQLGLLFGRHADAGVGDGKLDEAAAIAH